MREIKFRLWDKKEKVMYKGEDLGKLVGREEWELVNVDDDMLLTRNDVEELRDCVWLQYTGLKDSNGKLIYEGDILYTEWDNTTTTSVVRYYVDSTSSGFVFMIGGAGFSDFVGRENGKVIGNIYENPELLNKLNK